MRPQVELATLARAGVVLVLVAAGSVVAAIAGSALILYVPYATVGAILVLRRPRNGIGWLLTTIAWVFAVGFLPVRATVEGLQTLTAPPIVLAVAWFKSWSLPLGFALISCLAIVFPRGRLPVGRWRRPAVLLLVAMGAITLSAAMWPVLQVLPEGVNQMIVMPNPLGLVPPDRLDAGSAAIPAASFVFLFALLVATIVSMLARYARSDGIERLQLRWLVAGLAAVAITVPLGFLFFAAFGSAIQGVAWLPAIIAFTLPPIAIGVAVLRYRLYDIDRLISRTLTYGLLTVALVGVYSVGFVFIQALLAQFTSGGTIAVAVSTLAAFAISQPLRRRLQSAMDRRFNRSRYDAERTIESFASHLRDEFDLERVGSELGAVVSRSLAPASVGVWLRHSERIAGR